MARQEKGELKTKSDERGEGELHPQPRKKLLGLAVESGPEVAAKVAAGRLLKLSKI